MAITQVMKMTDYSSGSAVPLTPQAMEGFPWAAACSLCPWGTSLGGWRDTYDFAFEHARGHKIDEMNGKHKVPDVSPPNIAAILAEHVLEEFWKGSEREGADGYDEEWYPEGWQGQD